VEGACRATDKYHTLVAGLDGRAVGFLWYELKGETGEVVLLTVHPEFQRRGIATELNRAALNAMKAAGVKMAVAETGGDEGHAPARQAYEKVGYTASRLLDTSRTCSAPVRGRLGSQFAVQRGGSRVARQGALL
jgi:ribosomal protein S18 acetylase RimI-like enzyme